MVEIDEEQEEAERLNEVRRLAAELHQEWREREQPSVDDWAAEPGQRWAA
jgi:hypothetical protein